MVNIEPVRTRCWRWQVGDCVLDHEVRSNTKHLPSMKPHLVATLLPIRLSYIYITNVPAYISSACVCRVRVHIDRSHVAASAPPTVLTITSTLPAHPLVWKPKYSRLQRAAIRRPGFARMQHHMPFPACSLRSSLCEGSVGDPKPQSPDLEQIRLRAARPRFWVAFRLRQIALLGTLFSFANSLEARLWYRRYWIVARGKRYHRSVSFSREPTHDAVLWLYIAAPVPCTAAQLSQVGLMLETDAHHT